MTIEAARTDVLAPPDRLSDRLAAVLAARIERGELRPDDRLPTEVALSARHGVSRTVVREAVSRLKSMGLVVSRQGSGVYVAPRAAARPLAFDPTVLESLRSVMQIVEVRRALEGEVAALAAERARKADVKRIVAALDAIGAAAAAGGDGVDEDLSFHRAIAEAAGNPQFTRLLGFLEQYQRDAMRVTRANEARRSDFAEQVRQEHVDIAHAIAAGDAQAARRAATLHMVNAAARLQSADAPLRKAWGAPRKDNG
jgi:GntR family transcriptional repressor for pyruvate dehydrogenase complex